MKTVIATLFTAGSLVACATTYTPSEHVLAMRVQMDTEQADQIIARSIRGENKAWGPCLIGFNPGAVLNYSGPVTVNNANITFSGRFGKGQILGKTLLPDTKIEALRPQFEEKNVTVSASNLKEIRVLNQRLEQLRTWCPNVRKGYVVVMKPVHSLPADAEFSINVKTSQDLDSLLSALTFLSPNAKLVGGAGM